MCKEEGFVISPLPFPSVLHQKKLSSPFKYRGEIYECFLAIRLELNEISLPFTTDISNIGHWSKSISGC